MPYARSQRISQMKGNIMKKLLEDNYSANPAFNFDGDHWVINQELVDEFEKAYGNPREKIGKNQAIVILDNLSRIFAELETQTKNSYEKEFIQELKNESIKFLLEEFNFRFKLLPRERHFDDFRLEELNKFNRFFSFISPETLKLIQRVMVPEIDNFRENARNNKLKRSDLSSNTGKIVDEINRIVNKEFERQGIFELVSEHIGIKYKTVGVSLELSSEGSTWWKNNQFPGDSPKTMYAHLDESIYAPKAIVYLSDVTEHNGPTSGYIGTYEKFENTRVQDLLGRVIGNVGNNENSALKDYYKKQYHQSFASENFRKHFMMLPPQLRFNSHLGWDVIPNSELETRIAETEEVMLGPAGKFVVFDGSKLLHRGGLIEQGERIVLQVVISPKANLWNRGIKKIQKIVKGRNDA